MTKQTRNKRTIGLAVTTALATITLVGCTAKVAPPASASAAAAHTAIAKGKSSKAVEYAEAAVLAAPRDAATRALLGAAYIEAGRFGSAAVSLADAIELGDTSRRTIITYALAQIAAGRPDAALTTLDRWERAIDPADFGLAVALAGRPQQGVHVLGNALRAGQNTVKVRQNLAYAFALQGDWRSARLMAEQDVPADKVGDRLGHWARMALPEMFQHRVADLLGTRVATDPGQPVHLALSNHPSHGMMVAEAAGAVPAGDSFAFEESGELPPVGQPAAIASRDLELAAFDPSDTDGQVTQPVAMPVADTPAAPVVEAEPARRFVAREVVQNTPVRSTGKVAHSVAPRVSGRVAAGSGEPTPTQRAKQSFAMKPGDYRVQLGSYFSMSDAQAAWKLFQKRHPELEGAEKVITKANVKGKIYYRVAAGGFAKTSAQDMCSLVKKGGGGCIAYAANNPLPGTIDNNMRVARR